jgi:ribulose-bisphosphate carboxylase small chain
MENTMRITQGTLSYLPDLTDEEIKAEARYCLDNHWAISLEHTNDPHPRNAYWDMWGLPMFEVRDLDDVLEQIVECRRAFPDEYIKLNGYDRTKGRQTTMLSIIVHRPSDEPGFRLERTETKDRQVQYTIHSAREGRTTRA